LGSLVRSSPDAGYHKEFVPFSWRGFWAFGTGALGDMGCHLIDPAFKTVGLGYPSEVECSQVSIYEKMWTPDYFPDPVRPLLLSN